MNETTRMKLLRIFLRLSAVVLLVGMISWIALILLNVRILAPGSPIAPLLRFQPYNPYYESMLAAIYIVWAVMLWRTSNDPVRHLIFIDFTIWASVAHGLVMIIATPIVKGFFMTLVEGVPLFVLALVLWYLRPRSPADSE